jgi:hypothetical protein
MLITWKNMKSWIECRKKVKLPYIIGFFQYEMNGDKKWYPAHHAYYKWEDTTLIVDEYTLRHHTNIHQACYVLDNELLDYVIDHPYINPWIEDRYPPLETPNIEHLYGPLERGNTHIFGTPGLIKVIPVSHFEDFLIWHMPNKYVNRLGIGEEEMKKLICMK